MAGGVPTHTRVRTDRKRQVQCSTEIVRGQQCTAGAVACGRGLPGRWRRHSRHSPMQSPCRDLPETDWDRRPRHRREQRYRRRHRPPARRARCLRRTRGPPPGPSGSPCRRDRKAGGTALVVEADITDRTQAEAAVQQAVERFGRLDTLVNNAGLMLVGPVVGADGPSLTPLPPLIPSGTWGMLTASGCRRPPGGERPNGRASMSAPNRRGRSWRLVRASSRSR
jgi:hypothetical protein